MQASFSGRTVEGVVGQDEACWRSSAPVLTRWEEEINYIQGCGGTPMTKCLCPRPCRGESVGSHGWTSGWHGPRPFASTLQEQTPKSVTIIPKKREGSSLQPSVEALTLDVIKQE